MSQMERRYGQSRLASAECASLEARAPDGASVAPRAVVQYEDAALTLRDLLTDSGRLRVVQRPTEITPRAPRLRYESVATSLPGTAGGDTRRILIAENEQGNRQLMEHILSLAGYHTVSAADGLEALCTLREMPVDLVLIDLSMPRLDGLRTVGVIRTRYDGASLPVVAVSGHAQADVRERALSAGCTEFLAKPFRPRELLRVVGRLL